MTEAIAEDLKLIVFQLKDKEYAIPVNEALSIEKVQHITRVPGTPHFVKGVINLRGMITPIIDLRSRFELEEMEHTDNTRVIIVIINDFEVGLIVDSANDVMDVPKNSIEPSPEIVGAMNEEYIKGVTKVDKRLLILIDLEKVLKTSEMALLQGIEG